MWGALLSVALVTVVPGFQVPEGEAPAVAAYLADVAVDSGAAVRIDGDLVPWTLDLDVWVRLAGCESGGRWHLPSRPFGGGLQFLGSTWRSVAFDFAERPEDATVEEQIEAGRRLLDAGGWSQWPACSRALGYR